MGALIVADGGVGLGIMLVFVTAFVVLVGGVVGLVFRLIGGLIRFVGGVFNDGSQQAEHPDAAGLTGERRVCSDLSCRNSNPWAARYCAKCGRPLRR